MLVYLSVWFLFFKPTIAMPRRRSRTRRMRAGQSQEVSDWVGGMSEGGSITTIKSGSTVVPKDRPFRVLRVHFQVSAVGGGTLSANSALVQIDIFDPGATASESLGAVSTSGPRLVSPGSLMRGQVSNPSGRWFPTGIPAPIVRFSNIVQAIGDATVVRWVLRIDFLLRPEEFILVKPKLMLEPDQPSEGGSHVECYATG